MPPRTGCRLPLPPRRGLRVRLRGHPLDAAEIVNAGVEEGVRIVGLSILSGSHEPLVAAVIEGLKKSGICDVPVVGGGIIPPEDAAALKAAGVAAVYTPKDFDLNAIMAVIVAIVVRGARRAA